MSKLKSVLQSFTNIISGSLEISTKKQNKITSSNMLDYSLISGDIPNSVSAGNGINIEDDVISLNDELTGLTSIKTTSGFYEGNKRIATEEFVISKGYLTTHQSLDGYALYSSVSSTIETVNQNASIWTNKQDVISAGKNISFSNNKVALTDNLSGINSLSATIIYQSGNKVATEKYVDNRISSIINNAPEALDTLKEISDLLSGNSDEALAGSIINELSKKATKTELNVYALNSAVSGTIKTVNDNASIWANKQDEINSSNKLDYSLISGDIPNTLSAGNNITIDNNIINLGNNLSGINSLSATTIYQNGNKVATEEFIDNKLDGYVLTSMIGNDMSIASSLVKTSVMSSFVFSGLNEKSDIYADRISLNSISNVLLSANVIYNINLENITSTETLNIQTISDKNYFILADIKIGSVYGITLGNMFDDSSSDSLNSDSINHCIIRYDGTSAVLKCY